MATSKLKKKTKAERLASIVEPEDIIVDERDYVIKQAVIKDDFCTYWYEIIKGAKFGDAHKVDGSGIIDNDLIDAFGDLRVHMACIDDVFKHSMVEIDNIDRHHTDELTGLYVVTGLKISGGATNESVILKGSKHVSGGGRIDLTTPKIALDDLSSYKWHNELKVAVDKVLDEVALYKEGKHTAVESEVDETPNPKQMTISDQMSDDTKVFIPGGFKTMPGKANDVNWDKDNDGGQSNDDFENAKV